MPMYPGMMAGSATTVKTPVVTKDIKREVEMAPEYWEDLRKALCDYAENAWEWHDTPLDVVTRMNAIALKLGFKEGMNVPMPVAEEKPPVDSNTLPK